VKATPHLMHTAQRYFLALMFAKNRGHSTVDSNRIIL